jgi:pimeloyl-ACP methyl ester carboxylesterase
VVRSLRIVPVEPRPSVGDAHRGGSGEPLVLLHGLMMSWRVWKTVLPPLEDHHRIFAPTLPGHRGGPDIDPRAWSVASMAGLIEEWLDAEGIGTAHLVGNSLGGWLALEMLRRGRARSVVAFSPAGGWGDRRDLVTLHASVRAGTRLGRHPAVRASVASPQGRRMVLRTLFEHGERLSVRHASAVLEDLAQCRAVEGVIDAGRRDGTLETVRRSEVRVRIAWGEQDKVLPFARYGRPLVDRVPDAEVLLLRGAGHVPMYDDADAVVRTILEVTDRPSPRRSDE